MLASIRTRCAFLNSQRFLTTNGLPFAPPTYPGWPSIQVIGLKKWLRLISMSAGVIVAAAPPKMTFSPDDSKKLSAILKGPMGLPSPPPIAMASTHVPVEEMQWKSVRKESITLTYELPPSSTPLLVSSCAVPCSHIRSKIRLLAEPPVTIDDKA